jgi:YNFM family putative membrane transporter
MIVKSDYLRTVFILSFCALIVVSQLYIPIPIVSVFCNYFAIPISSAVWLGSAFGFAYASGFLVFGPLSDRFGRKTIMVPGLILLGIITIGIGFTESFDLLIYLRILQGFIAATFAPAALAYISEQLPQEYRATAVACVSTGFMTAGVLGQLFASEINLNFGWHAIFLSLGVTYLVMCLLLKFFVKEVTQNHKSGLNLRSFYLGMLNHLKDGSLVISYVCSFALLFSFVAMYAAISPYLINYFHFSSSQLFNVRLLGLVGMLVAPFSGILVKKFGSKNVMYVGFLIAAFSILCEGLSGIKEIVIFSTIPFVASIAISAPALISYISASAINAKGSAIALYTFILFLGAAVGTLFANHLEPYGFKVITLIISIILMLVIMLFALFQKFRLEVAAQKC